MMHGGVEYDTVNNRLRALSSYYRKCNCVVVNYDLHL